MDWRAFIEFFASIGYGLLSSFVPVFNSEVYIVAAQALGLTAEISAAIGVALGQTIGKTAIVLGLRHGTRLTFLSQRIDRLRARTADRDRSRPPGRVRRTLARWSAALLELAGHSRWGALIVLLAGATGIPPIFALQFIIPATKMPAWLFAVALFLGRCVLFLAIAFGANAVIARFFG